jgi:hypothetical protein
MNSKKQYHEYIEEVVHVPNIEPKNSRNTAGIIVNNYKGCTYFLMSFRLKKGYGFII